MTDAPHSSSESHSAHVANLEKADHAAQLTESDGANISTLAPLGDNSDNETTSRKEEEYTGEEAEDLDDDDPFSLFPALSITMSSTKAPYSRRSTMTSMGRPLTREETRATLKSVRSRFTEVRSEFDENDDIPELATIDENLVTFDGPKDPMNPKNWPNSKKWATTGLMALYVFLSPFASSILAPAVSQVGREFGESNTTILSLLVSVFVLAFAVGPLIAGPASELFGRAIVLHVSMALFFVFSIACAVSQTTAQLAVFRFLSGLAGGAPLAIGAGVLADIWEAKERGRAVAIFSLGPPIAPTIAPIIAGFISLRTTWRWVMWVLVFATGITTVIGILFLHETFPPTILLRKAKKLRKETGNMELKTVFEATEEGESTWHKVGKNLIRPAKLLTQNFIVFVLSLYMALTYGYLYLMFTTFPELFGVLYGENVGIVGLNYIGVGLGSLLGFFGSLAANLVYDRLSEANNGKGLPEYRLPTLFITSWFVPIGLFWYGWSAQAHTHWIVPVLGTMFFGLGFVSIFVAIQNYLVDGFRFAASALAASSVLRSLFGFAFPLFGHQMYAKLGYGWGNSLLGFLAIVIGVPFPILIFRYGARLRQHGYGGIKDA